MISSIVITTTLAGTYIIGTVGWRRVRCRVSAYTSGNCVVTARGTEAVHDVLVRGLTANAHVTATALANPLTPTSVTTSPCTRRSVLRPVRVPVTELFWTSKIPQSQSVLTLLMIKTIRIGTRLHSLMTVKKSCSPTNGAAVWGHGVGPAIRTFGAQMPSLIYAITS